MWPYLPPLFWGAPKNLKKFRDARGIPRKRFGWLTEKQNFLRSISPRSTHVYIFINLVWCGNWWPYYQVVKEIKQISSDVSRVNLLLVSRATKINIQHVFIWCHNILNKVLKTKLSKNYLHRNVIVKVSLTEYRSKHDLHRPKRVFDQFLDSKPSLSWSNKFRNTVTI